MSPLWIGLLAQGARAYNVRLYGLYWAKHQIKNILFSNFKKQLILINRHVFLRGNDYETHSTQSIFRKNNIKVPEDVGIIGFDNIAILDNMSPRLTSVDCNIKTTGRKATTNLIRMINGEKDIKDCVVDYNIVEGETL